MRAATKRALERLTKWRRVLAAWQFGADYLMVDKEHCPAPVAAVRDHRELSLLMRAELSALVILLVEKGVFTVDEWEAQLEHEAMHLDVINEQKFPGFVAGDDGMTLHNPEALRTLQSLFR